MRQAKKKYLRNSMTLLFTLTFLLNSIFLTQPQALAEQIISTIQPSTVEERLPFTSISGLVPEPFTLKYPKFIPTRNILPSSYTSNYVSSIQNQGINGTCWIFSAIAGVESNILKNNLSTNPDLSELHMAYSTSVNSDGNNGNIEQGFYRQVNSGGNRSYATAYLIRGSNLSGTVDESQDMYAPYISAAIPTRNLSITQSKAKNFTVENIMFLGDDDKSEINTTKIKEAVQQYGAVPCSMYWDGESTTADTGSGSTDSYNANTAAYFYGNTPQNTNHAVTIVGWDDDYPVTNFNASQRPSENGAWLIKNSWGDDWGNDGYFWISYQDTNAPMSPWVIDGVKEFNQTETVYEYDPHGMTAYYGSDGTARYGANVFTLESDNEILSSVKLYAPFSNARPDIYVVKNYTDSSSLNINNLSSNVVKVASAREFTWPGYYTVNLETPIVLGGAGSKFAVIVKYVDSDGKNGLVPFETNSGQYSSTTNYGTSFYSENGSNWSDMTEKTSQEPCNINIKAVTVADSKAVDVAISNLTWDSIRGNNLSQASVAEDLATLPTTGAYQTTINWVSDKPSVLSNTGKVTRQSANTNVTLTATITKNNETKQKVFNITVIVNPVNASEAIQQAKSALTWDIIKGANSNLNSVESNLTLPTTGINATNISWHSDNPQISANGDVITYTKITDNLIGNLTATITKSGGTPAQVVFTVTVNVTDNIQPQIKGTLPEGYFVEMDQEENLVIRFTETVQAVAGKTISISARPKEFKYDNDHLAYPFNTNSDGLGFIYTIPSSPNIVSGVGEQCVATIPLDSFKSNTIGLKTFATDPGYYTNTVYNYDKIRAYSLYIAIDAFTDLSDNDMFLNIYYNDTPSYARNDIFFSKSKLQPEVLSVNPGNGAIDVGSDGKIGVTFNKQMNKTVAGTIKLNNTELPQGSWSADGLIYTTSYRDLDFNRQYTVNISNFSDPDGNIINPDNSNTFTTNSGPKWTYTPPDTMSAGKTITLSSGIPNQTCYLTLSLYNGNTLVAINTKECRVGDTKTISITLPANFESGKNWSLIALVWEDMSQIEPLDGRFKQNL